jgi:hypothetical protein
LLSTQPAILFTTLHRSSIDLVTRSARSLDTSLQLTLALFLEHISVAGPPLVHQRCSLRISVVCLPPLTVALLTSPQLCIERALHTVYTHTVIRCSLC